MNDTLTFSLPDCLISEDAKADFTNQIADALSSGHMPDLCLSISPRTSDKDIFQAIQVIGGINRFLNVSFQFVDDSESLDTNPEGHPAWGYLKICQSWLPNATVLM